MAAYTEAMKWYNLGGLKAARTKYHFKVEFFSKAYSTLQADARMIFDRVRTAELPKYSIESEVINAWNVRQVVPTKINFEPISITFTDTLDNSFQKFIVKYMNIISGSFVEQTKSLRKGFDSAGLNILANSSDCPIDRIEIIRFYDGDVSSGKLENQLKVTLWRPKIIDIQHDTLDYSASEAITWTISLRYESVTYDDGTSPTSSSANSGSGVAGIAGLGGIAGGLTGGLGGITGAINTVKSNIPSMPSIPNIPSIPTMPGFPKIPKL